MITDEVTSIGENAFYRHDCLESIEIPEGMTSIGKNAFFGCYRLTDVHYSGTLEQWKNIKIYPYNEMLDHAVIHYDVSMPTPTPKPETKYTINDIQISDGTVSVNVTKVIGTGAKLIVSSYTEDGAFIGITFRDIDGAGMFKMNFDTDKAEYVSAFIWDSFSDITPVSNKVVKDL